MKEETTDLLGALSLIDILSYHCESCKTFRNKLNKLYYDSPSEPFESLLGNHPELDKEMALFYSLFGTLEKISLSKEDAAVKVQKGMKEVSKHVLGHRDYGGAAEEEEEVAPPPARAAEEELEYARPMAARPELYQFTYNAPRPQPPEGHWRSKPREPIYFHYAQYRPPQEAPRATYPFNNPRRPRSTQGQEWGSKGPGEERKGNYAFSGMRKRPAGKPNQGRERQEGTGDAQEHSPPPSRPSPGASQPPKPSPGPSQPPKSSPAKSPAEKEPSSAGPIQDPKQKSTPPDQPPKNTPPPKSIPSNPPKDTKSPPSQPPSQAPSQAPSQTPSQAPSQTPSQTPSQAPSQPPSQPPSKPPSQPPSQAPSRTPDIPQRIKLEKPFHDDKVLLQQLDYFMKMVQQQGLHLPLFSHLLSASHRYMAFLTEKFTAPINGTTLESALKDLKTKKIDLVQAKKLFLMKGKLVELLRSKGLQSKVLSDLEIYLFDFVSTEDQLWKLLPEISKQLALRPPLSAEELRITGTAISNWEDFLKELERSYLRVRYHLTFQLQMENLKVIVKVLFPCLCAIPAELMEREKLWVIKDGGRNRIVRNLKDLPDFGGSLQHSLNEISKLKLSGEL